MNKIRIVGMAKTTLSNNSGPHRSLELDFLQLLFFKREQNHKNKDFKIIAYLSIFKEKEEFINRLKKKYLDDQTNDVTILFFSEEIKEKIKTEIKGNKVNGRGSTSSNRKIVGEEFLKTHIQAHHTWVDWAKNSGLKNDSISWDFEFKNY